MSQLKRSDLMSLEQYSNERTAFRSRVLEHKKNRKLHLGPNFTLLFEDRLTIQYQIQEMLRIEKIFDSAGIEEELSAYNPLIPNGSNLKATLLIEYADIEQRKIELARLANMERAIYSQVEGFDAKSTIADEDLDRSNSEKTSAVHFLRFEFSSAEILALKTGSNLIFGINDERMPVAITVDESIKQCLLADFS